VPLVNRLHEKRVVAQAEADLQLTGDPAVGRRWRRWRHLDRITVVALLLIMAATVAGLFGGGPLSYGRAHMPSGRADVTYERFGRFGASMRTTVQLLPDESAAIVLSNDYLDGMHIQRIVPEPAETRAVPGGVEYVFAHTAGTPLTIHLDVQPNRRGAIDGSVTANGERLTWRHFIYP
jgi:hypothetical protein